MNSQQDFIINDGVLEKYTGSDTAIVIPDGVTQIAPKVFMSTEIRSVSIPSSVESIGEDAFAKCYELEIVYIEDLAAWCQIKFKNLCANPLGGAFGVSYDANNTEYHTADLFINGDKTDDLVIPEGVSIIQPYAFCGSNIKSVTVPGSLKKICSSVFEFCLFLEAVYTADITTWLGMFFSNRGANPLGSAHNLYVNGELVKKLVVPDGVEKIQCAAFTEASCIESVAFPESLSAINSYAFDGCSSIDCLVVPETVKDIGKNISDGPIYFKGKIIDDFKEEKVKLQALLGFVLKYKEDDVPQDIIESYVRYFESQRYVIGLENIHKTFSLFDFAIKHSVLTTEDANVMLSDLPENQKVEEHAMLIEYINRHSDLSGDGFFDFDLDIDYCSAESAAKEWLFTDPGQGNITLLKYLGSSENVTCPSKIGNSNVTVIGQQAFWECENIVSVTIPEPITEIGEMAFCGCRKLENVNIPDTVTEIGKGAFSVCESLKDIQLPYGLEKIDFMTFCGCLRLESVDIPYTVTELGEKAFDRCVSLKSIYIPDGVKTLVSRCFSDCLTLMDVSVYKYTKIDSGAFLGAHNVVVTKRDEPESADDDDNDENDNNQPADTQPAKNKAGRCQYCGGELKKTLFSIVCKSCGKKQKKEKKKK